MTNIFFDEVDHRYAKLEQVRARRFAKVALIALAFQTAATGLVVYECIKLHAYHNSQHTPEQSIPLTIDHLKFGG